MNKVKLVKIITLFERVEEKPLLHLAFCISLDRKFYFYQGKVREFLKSVSVATMSERTDGSIHCAC